MLPTGLVCWLAFVVAGFFCGTAVAAPLAALAGATVLLAEAGGAIYFLGAAFESFDLTAELTN
jgi:choline dehydrogenase-like flavoprotein